jgi:hypothetical protein
MKCDRAGTSILPLGTVALGVLLAAAAAAQTTSPAANPPMTAPIVLTAPPAPPPAPRHDSERPQPVGEPLPLAPPAAGQPGASAPYAAPQYPSSGAPTGRTCRQYAPAYDEAGRFLANVCVR